MQEFWLAQEILKAAIEYAEKRHLKSVKNIVINLGDKIAFMDSKENFYRKEIIPENLQIYIKLLAKGTIAQNAQIKIKPIEGEYWGLEKIEGE